METKKCKTCEEIKELDKFPKYGGRKKRDVKHRPHCKSCTYIKDKSSWNEEKREKMRGYHKTYHKKHPEVGKIKSYQSVDRRLGRKTLTLAEGKRLILGKICFYCEEDDDRKIGLDRMDNSKGHDITNVVSCCEKCNMLLSDIPFEAKLELKDGLKRIKEKELLEKWEIPTKRRKSQ